MKQNIIKAALASLLAPVFGSGFGQLTERMDQGAVPFATYNYKGGVLGGTGAGPTFSHQPFSVAEIKMDFAAIAADRAAAGQAAIGAADVLELFGIKAGIWVPVVAIQTVTAEGAAATCDLGDGTSAAGYASNHDLNAVGWSSSLATVALSLATAGGKLYTADDTIDMVVDSASVDVAVANVFVTMVDLRRMRV